MVRTVNVMLHVFSIIICGNKQHVLVGDGGGDGLADRTPGGEE